MKLKALLLTKFLNKYTAKGQSARGLAEYVHQELDEMFVGDKFDERDLVKIDRRVRMFIKQQKMESLNKTIDVKVNEKLTQQLSSNKCSGARQASETPKLAALSSPKLEKEKFRAVSGSVDVNMNQDAMSRRSGVNSITRVQSNRASSNAALDYTPATIYLQAKKEDYWSKVVSHNSKLHELELRTEKDNKYAQQKRVRQMLQDQLNMQRGLKNDENEKDRQMVSKQMEDLRRANEADNQKRQKYKDQLQAMNRERTEQARLAKEGELREKMAMADYIDQIKLANIHKEENEKKKRQEYFHTQHKHAMGNIQHHEELKEQLKKDLQAERAKYSPLKSMVKTASVCEKKKTQEPQFDDFMNSVFQKKVHKSILMVEKKEKVHKLIEEKFFKARDNKEKDMNDRIQREFEERAQRNADMLDAKNKHLQGLAAQAREFQMQQVADKKSLMEQIRSKEHQAARREFKKHENLTQKDREKAEVLLKKRRDNQSDLFRQIEMKNQHNIVQDNMNTTDVKLNSNLLSALNKAPVLPPVKQRKLW